MCWHCMASFSYRGDGSGGGGSVGGVGGIGGVVVLLVVIVALVYSCALRTVYLRLRVNCHYHAIPCNGPISLLSTPIHGWHKRAFVINSNGQRGTIEVANQLTVRNYGPVHAMTLYGGGMVCAWWYGVCVRERVSACERVCAGSVACLNGWVIAWMGECVRICVHE